VSRCEGVQLLPVSTSSSNPYTADPLYQTRNQNRSHAGERPPQHLAIQRSPRLTPEPVYANGSANSTPISRSPSPVCPPVYSVTLPPPTSIAPSCPSQCTIPRLVPPSSLPHCATSPNLCPTTSGHNLDLPRNLIILATPPTPTAMPPQTQEEFEKPFKTQLSIPLTTSRFLLPPTPSSEPVSPAAPFTATLGYSSDPCSPCPQNMGGLYASYQPNFHPYQNTLIKSEPSSHNSSRVLSDPLHGCSPLDLAISNKGYFPSDGGNGVSYENIDVNQISSLCNEGYSKPAVIRALLISRNDSTLARDILKEYSSNKC